MTTKKSYMRIFDNEADAVQRMIIKNRAHKKGDGQIFVLVDHPDDQYAVMDIDSAIDNDFCYRWEV